MKLFSFFSKKVVIGLVLVAVVALVIGMQLGGGSGKQRATVVRADIVQEVASTGKVKPNQSVSLGFDRSGRVQNVYAAIGDTVSKGQVIASLEAGEITADLNKAKALLEEENIKLREIKSTAPISYNDASKNLEAVIKESFASADNAVRNKADQFFKTSPDNPKFEISITSGNFVHYFNVPASMVIEINNERKVAETILDDWQNRIVSGGPAGLVAEANRAIDDLNRISLFLNKVAEAVNTFAPAEYTYETTVNNYKTTIASARTEVSGAVSTMVTAKDKLNTAPTLGQTGQFESVLAQESKVAQAAAAVSALQASLDKSLVRAPFDGVITLQDAKVGATVASGAGLISVVSREEEIYVEANISEIHIGKLAVGNPVVITFDAFSGEEFEGQVSYIEPGDVIVDGVVNYKVRVALKSPEARIKNGLTANLYIQTAKKGSVLTLPLYAVSKEAEESFVNKLVEEKAVKTPVQLGAVGNNGGVEVINGLNEGDIVEF